MSKRLLAAVGVLAMTLVAATSAWANHGPMTDHLAPSSANVDLVSKLKLSNVRPSWVADVATYRDTAYLAGWAPMCTESPSQRGGFWSVDISNPNAPRELTFVPAAAGAYLTEGMHALRVTTPAFTGEILAVSNEPCNTATGPGGMSLYNVTNPAAPVALVEGFGDTTGTAPRAHSSHSIFAWDTGPKAYAALADNVDAGTSDVDIFDITDPRNPVQIDETGIGDWPAAQDNLAFGSTTFVHDLVVRRVEGRWLMLLSYWDAGYVVLDVTDPANPVYVKDSDFPVQDPFINLPGGREGNAHEAEWDRCPEEGVRSRFPCGDVRYILGADEDFSTYRLSEFRMTTGPNAGDYQGGEFGFTIPIAQNFPDGVMQGPTVWGGSGCVEDLNGNGTSDRAEVPPASSVPAGPGETKIVVFTRGTCFFSIKVESGQLAGYDAVAVANSHGQPPDAAFCGAQGHEYTKTASGICIGHRMMHLLFNDTPAYTGPNDGSDMPPLGTVGQKIRVRSAFDGWGWLNLIDADTMQHLDAFSVPEAVDERYATGFGTLSIHEITTDPTGDVGYIAWYSAGFRVVDYTGGRLREVGHHIDTAGNDIWGVELNVRADGRLYTVASDRDYGLYIYRFGTDLTTTVANARGTVGRGMTLRATVRNDGTIAETNAKWSIRLPRGVRAVGAFASQGRCTITGTRTVSCNLGTIAEGARAGISLRVVSSRAGSLRARGLVAGIKAEYDVGNNTDPTVLRVRAGVAGTGGALTGRRP